MDGNICPVDVISVCSANGDIRPLRLRMEDEEHQLLLFIDLFLAGKGVEQACYSHDPTSFPDEDG